MVMVKTAAMAVNKPTEISVMMIIFSVWGCPEKKEKKSGFS